MAVPWVSRVEYVCDRTQADIDLDWFLDLCKDDCPAYDPDRKYRAFWSPIEGDSPDAMLERVPMIPILTEAQQKAHEPGYYEVVILGIEDDKAKFESKRIRKQVNRGSKTKVPKNSSSQGKESQPKITDKVKNQAGKKNLADRSSRNDGSVFKDFDSKMPDSLDYDSDDSVTDPSLVSENQVKVLKTSIRNLKKKLLEKCDECEKIEKKLKERDEELEKLRMLNRGLQETVLSRMSSILAGSASSSRSSSHSSLNMARSHPTSPLLSPRSRSLSTSSSCSGMSRCASPLSRAASPLASPHSREPAGTNSPLQKRKTPPNTPSSSGVKRVSHGSSKEQTRTERMSPIRKLYTESGSGSFDDSSSTTTILNDSTNTTIQGIDDDDSLMDTNGDSEINDATTEAQPNDTMVDFCTGFKVDKEKLANIEARALGKSNDSTYVKEMAVLVFGLKTLYNSSISERKYSRSNEVENQKLRPKLDETAVAAIAARLQKRIEREFNGVVPHSDIPRFKLSAVNRLIYDKMKRMRQNDSFKHLEAQQ